MNMFNVTNSITVSINKFNVWMEWNENHNACNTIFMAKLSINKYPLNPTRNFSHSMRNCSQLQKLWHLWVKSQY